MSYPRQQASLIRTNGFRNAIINGAFNIWQRGTTFTSIASGAYGPDRYFYGKSGAVVHDILRSTDVPTVAQSGRLFNYSMHLDVTTADSSIAAGDYCIFSQVVEGFNWEPLAQKPFTVSFWVKDTITGTHNVAARNSGVDRSCVMEYTISAADTWEYKTVTFPASPSAGTWDYTTGIGLYISFPLSGGSTFQTTAGSWATGNFLTTAAGVNSTSSTSNNFKITGIQLESGYVATPFEQRNYTQELLFCKRYYNEITIPMSNIFFAYYGGSNATSIPYHYPIPMRISPNLTITNSGIEYYSYAGVWTASTLTSWSTTINSVQVTCASDGDGRGKLVQSGSSGANPSPILKLNAEF